MTDIEILTSARDMILKHGWIQDASGDKTRGFCLLGAMSHHVWSESFPKRQYFFGALLLLEHVIRPSRAGHRKLTEAAFSRALDHVTSWNDNPKRTRAQVIDGLNRAIALAQAEAAIGRAKQVMSERETEMA